MQTDEGNVYCTNCGAAISPEMAFCPDCGGDLAAQRTAPPTGTGGMGIGGTQVSPQEQSGTGTTPPWEGGAVPPATAPVAPPVTGVGPAVPRKRIGLGLGLAVACLVLVVVAIASMTWFTVEDDDGEASMTFGLQELELTMTVLGETVESEGTYEELEADEGEMTMDEVAGTTWWLLLAGLVVTGLFILFGLLALVGVFRGATGWIPVVSGLAAGILVLVAVSYFAFGFQPALEEDIGVELEEGEGVSYGLGAMWYLALAGGVLAILGGLLAKPASAAPAPVPPPVQM